MERQFVWWLVAHGVLGPRDLFFAAFSMLGSAAQSREQGYVEYHGYLGGRPVKDVDEWAARCMDDRIMPRVPKSAIGEINGHRADGRKVVLLSGSILPLVTALGERVGADAVVSSEPESVRGVYTGRLIGNHLGGPRKADRILALSQSMAWDLAESYGYADHYTDERFLECFGHPRPTNPDKRLQAIAQARGWPIVRFR
jgi:HAD superfamily hydrolase (TIGR01490 family)